MSSASKARDTHSARDAIRGYLHQGVIVIFIRNYRSDSPRLRAMSRRERVSSIEKLAPLPAGLRSSALGDCFESVNDDFTVYECLTTKNSRFAGAVIFLFATDKVKRHGDSSDAISRASITNNSARFLQAIEFGYFISRYAISSNQRHRPDACGHHPLRIGSVKLERRRPNRFLIAKNVFEKLLFE